MTEKLVLQLVIADTDISWPRTELLNNIAIVSKHLLFYENVLIIFSYIIIAQTLIGAKRNQELSYGLHIATTTCSTSSYNIVALHI